MTELSIGIIDVLTHANTAEQCFKLKETISHGLFWERNSTSDSHNTDYLHASFMVQSILWQRRVKLN